MDIPLDKEFLVYISLKFPEDIHPDMSPAGRHPCSYAKDASGDIHYRVTPSLTGVVRELVACESLF